MRCKVSEDMSEAQLWAVMQSLSGRTFMTAKGLQFTVTLAGNELFVSRKRKSITRATVWRAYMRLLELQARGEVVDGPKKLGTFGASYLYAIFIAIGVLPTSMLEVMEASNGNMRGCREMDMPPPLPNDANDAIADNIIRPHNHSLRSTCIFPLSVYNGIQENNKGESDMPRGVKGSGKGTAAKKEVQKVVAEKTRKPYPSIDERIALADQEIERLTKLNASRAELIAQTEAKLAERKAALAKSGSAGEGRGQEGAPAGGKGEARQGGEAEAERGRAQRAPEGSAGEGARGQEGGEREIRCAGRRACRERQDSGRAAGRAEEIKRHPPWETGIILSLRRVLCVLA